MTENEIEEMRARGFEAAAIQEAPDDPVLRPARPEDLDGILFTRDLTDLIEETEVS